MTRRLRLMALATAVLAVSGCSIFGGDDEEAALPPTPLTDFSATLQLDRVIKDGVGGGGGVLRYALRPSGDGTRAYAAGADGTVVAYDAVSGKRTWRVKLDGTITAGPGAGDGRLAVADRSGGITALDARTGDVLWRQDISAEVLAPPVLGGERVIVRSVDGRLLALSGATGEVLWFIEQPVPRLSQRGTGAPVIVGDAVVAGFDNGRILAADLLSGEVLWELPLGIPSGRSDIERMVDADGALAASGNDLYVTGFRARTAAIAAESGQALWARELSSYAGLGIDWTNVYMTLEDDQVIALSRSNGTQQWSNEKFLRRQLTAPVAFGEYVVVGDLEGYLHFVSARSGTLAARVRVDDAPIVQRPYVMGETLYAQSSEGTLVGYRERGERR
ncbi:MAG: outer membrane protein assembly factor BamB [Pseudomonadota bacterium]